MRARRHSGPSSALEASGLGMIFVARHASLAQSERLPFPRVSQRPSRQTTANTSQTNRDGTRSVPRTNRRTDGRRDGRPECLSASSIHLTAHKTVCCCRILRRPCIATVLLFNSRLKRPDVWPLGFCNIPEKDKHSSLKHQFLLESRTLLNVTARRLFESNPTHCCLSG